MRFISMVKFTEKDAVPPPKAFLEAMNQLVTDVAKEGCTMVDGVGLLPTSAGARVRLAGGKVTVMDGPFTEAKEVVGGYAIFEANSNAEMIKCAERFMDLHRKYLPGWDGECEIRQIAGPGEKLCEQVHATETVAV